MNENMSFQEYLRQGIRSAGKQYLEQERRRAEAARRAADNDQD